MNEYDKVKCGICGRMWAGDGESPDHPDDEPCSRYRPDPNAPSPEPAPAVITSSAATTDRERCVALEKELADLRKACSREDDEICQTLGKALGYPWFKDDQKNFPGATEANGVCVGDHVAASLAAEAAAELRGLNGEVRLLRLHDDAKANEIRRLRRGLWVAGICGALSALCSIPGLIFAVIHILKGV